MHYFKVSFVRLSLLLGALALGLSACAKKEIAPPPPPSVEVAKPLVKSVPIFVESVGQTRGSVEVDIRARVEGFLETVNFDEGTYVKKGQLLYTIDPRTAQASASEAKGKLAEAQANYMKAKQDVVRYKPLVEKNAISRQEYDTAVAYEQAAQAAVASAKAAADAATIDLSYTKIEAPISGLIGKTEVKAGNLVSNKDNTLLTVISENDPIHVRLAISEKDYLTLARERAAMRGEEVSAEAKAQHEKEEGNLELILADGSVHPQKGKVVFADRNVDPTTGTLLVEVGFPNPDRLIRSGQYARVRAEIGFKENALLIPQRAVQELQGTYSVAVVGSDNAVTMRPVQMGPRVGSLWVVNSGLKPDEQVVVEGVQKARAGMTVTPTVVAIKDDTTAAPAPAADAPKETPATSVADSSTKGE